MAALSHDRHDDATRHMASYIPSQTTQPPPGSGPAVVLLETFAMEMPQKAGAVGLPPGTPWDLLGPPGSRAMASTI